MSTRSKWTGTESAFPSEMAMYEDGLSKREYFAGLAMQGFAANPNSDLDFTMTANAAVRQADALLEALEK